MLFSLSWSLYVFISSGIIYIAIYCHMLPHWCDMRKNEINITKEMTRILWFVCISYVILKNVGLQIKHK